MLLALLFTRSSKGLFWFRPVFVLLSFFFLLAFCLCKKKLCNAIIGKKVNEKVKRRPVSSCEIAKLWKQISCSKLSLPYSKLPSPFIAHPHLLKILYLFTKPPLFCNPHSVTSTPPKIRHGRHDKLHFNLIIAKILKISKSSRLDV